MTKTPKAPEGPDNGQTVTVCVDIKLKGVAAIDWLAERDGVDREEEARRLIAEAVLARKRLIAARELGDLKRAESTRPLGPPAA
jgi:hypothetical protein